MILIKDGCIYETENKFVIEQMKKYGAVEQIELSKIEPNKTTEKKLKLKK